MATRSVAQGVKENAKDVGWEVVLAGALRAIVDNAESVNYYLGVMETPSGNILHARTVLREWRKTQEN